MHKVCTFSYMQILLVAVHYCFFYSAADKAANLEKLLNWLTKSKSVVDEVLSQHRGVLFRGFGAVTPEDFDKIVVASGYKYVIRNP